MKRGSQLPARHRAKVMVISPLAALILAACGASGELQAASLNPSSVGAHPGASPTASTASPWKLTWEDDFTGSGAPANWTPDIGGNGFGDEQLEWNSNDNARLTGHGGLIISADKGGDGQECWYGACEYTAAKIQTTFAQEYGLFEARIKLPPGAGLWPAFWMIPAGQITAPGTLGGEIDIIEVNNKSPYLVKGYAHDGSVFTYGAQKVVDVPPASGYHIYGIEWTPSGITWLYDGQPYGSIKAYKNWPFDKPFIMVLDLAVGGTWPGPPNAETVFPAQLDVSWVRVYKANQ